MLGLSLHHFEKAVGNAGNNTGCLEVTLHAWSSHHIQEQDTAPANFLFLFME